METHTEFDWSVFGERTCQAVAEYFDCREPKYLDWLRTEHPYPDDLLIKYTKDIWLNYWLVNHPNLLREICEHLKASDIGRRSGPNNGEEIQYVHECGNRKRVRKILLEAIELVGYHRADPKTQDKILSEPFRVYAIINPSNQKDGYAEDYEHQIDAMDKLDSAWRDKNISGSFCGLLEMPTGSGKTRTAVKWIMGKHINEGGKVLWIAHRSELLRQAANEFDRWSYIASKRSTIKRLVISSEYLSASLVDTEADIVIANIQSAWRSPQIQRFLEEENVLLVIDEAHHSYAPKYRNLISLAKKRTSKLLLGLTATPTRTNEEELCGFFRLFDNTRIYSVDLHTLIERGVLARPRLESIQTKVIADGELNSDDYNRLAIFHQLSTRMERKLATSVARNNIIVEQYQKNTSRYGKTIVFAIDVLHAEQLTKDFRDAGINAEYIACYGIEKDLDIPKIVERFRDPKSGLNVLMNVQMLTEGVDIPEVRTVFLTRPTRSEILLRQMIGRALRRKSSGEQIAYLVAFNDEWNEFRGWADPFDYLPELASEDETLKIPAKAKTKVLYTIPWEVIHDLLHLLRSAAPRLSISKVIEAIPAGWYLLQGEPQQAVEDLEEEIEDTQILVYENQRDGWAYLVERLWEIGPSEVHEQSDLLYQECFGDCEILPSKIDYEQMLAYRLRGQNKPEFSSYPEREEIDPDRVALLIKDNNLRESEQTDLIKKLYQKPLAQTIYPTEELYHNAIDLAKSRLRNGELNGRYSICFNDLPDGKVTPPPPGGQHNLEHLLEQVIQQGKRITDIHDIPKNIKIQWTNRPVIGFYGHARYGDHESLNLIRINRLLDTPDFSGEAMKFLIWHELLHVVLKSGHTQEFRKYERLWPDYAKYDNEMDSIPMKYEMREKFWK